MQRILTSQDTQTASAVFENAIGNYIVHDIFGLISTIDAVADFCTKSKDGLIQNQGQRLARCSKRILNICTDATQRELDDVWKPDRSISSLIMDAACFASDHAKENTRVIVNCTEDEQKVPNSNIVFRVIYNVLTNAVQAVNRHGGGSVRIAAKAVDGLAFVEIADDGPGILGAQKNAENGAEFDGKARRRPGMGLQIAEYLMDTIDGTLSIAHTGSSGTSFRIVVSLTEKEAEH
ncbi:MAG: ATP-binding protein [Pseudomonadota bacterium]